MKKEVIQSDRAPQAIGIYSQAVKVGNTVYLSGQIPLVPGMMELEKATCAPKSRACSRT